MQHNPIIDLTPEQTTQLRHIWNNHRQELHPDDFTFGKVKLTRSQAKLTKNQIYRMMMTLAEIGYEQIPEWLIALFDPQESK